MQLASSAAAIPAVAMLPVIPAEASPVDHSAIGTTERKAAGLWRIALTEYGQAKARMDAAAAAYSQAEEAANAARPIDFYEEYRLHANLTRKQVLEKLRYYPAEMAGIAREAGKSLTDAQIDELYRRIPSIADAYFAQQKAFAEAKKLHSVDELDDAASAAGDATYEAEQKLLDTPAPDGAAVLVKLALVADQYSGPGGEDHGFRQLGSDLRRIFGAA